MKYLILIITALMIMATPVSAQFDKYFSDKTFRIDYFHTGNAAEEEFTLDQVYIYGIWGGSRKNLLDNFNNGRYYYKIYDAAGGELIFSKGFDSYFGEYRTSEPGVNGIKRTYHETAIIPLPKNKIKFTLESRDKQNKLNEIFSVELDPSDISFIREEPQDEGVKVYQSLAGGDPSEKVDVVILGEGYTKTEESKFKKDIDRFTGVLFSLEPYKSLKEKFNVYGVFKASQESGTDEPFSNIYKKTVFSTTFNSLGSERYLLTEDNKAVRDLAAHVPYDAIYIMVNHSRYGGGGIYNLFCTFTADNHWHEYLFLHEFGHSFAGLADEYYTSDVAYNEFYTKGVEPVEPNITMLLNNELKWKSLADKDIEIPTPWEKADYDKMDYKWQAERRELNKKVIELKRERAAAQQVKTAEEEYNAKDREHSAEVDKYLKASKYRNMVGAYEGAGYSSEGMYRSMLDCIMFSKGTKPYCKVCEDHIKKVIAFYSE